LCVPGGNALPAPVPHDTPFTGPRCPDPEEDISAGSNLCHAVRLLTSHPPFFNGGANWLSVIFIPGPLLCSFVLASSWGAFILLLSFSSSSWGVFNPLLLFSSSLWWVFLLVLFRWDNEGHNRIVASATCFGGLCFYGHSSICHS
jgi:hypothetical protein